MTPAGYATAGILVALLSTPGAGAPHDRSFWLSIVQNKYEVPAGESPFALLVEMNELLGSPDPVLRDDVAYSAAARWIYTKRLLTPDQQRNLLALWSDNLLVGLGEPEGDTVFRRSFSALNLSTLAALDNQAPFMTQVDYDQLLARALEYLARERDTRGYDPAKGWIHTAAHTADLLKFLARSPRLALPMQARLLEALRGKCEQFGHTFAWGEDERLAEVAHSLARRTDFDRAAFGEWLSRYAKASDALWARGPHIDAAAFAGVQNQKLLLRALFAVLSRDSDLSQAALEARQGVINALQ